MFNSPSSALSHMFFNGPFLMDIPSLFFIAILATTTIIKPKIHQQQQQKNEIPEDWFYAMFMFYDTLIIIFISFETKTYDSKIPRK